MSVFVVEDDADLRWFLEMLLVESSVRVFSSGRDALQALQATVPNVLLCDLALPDMKGEDVAAAAARMTGAPRIVLMSGEHERLDRARPLAWRVLKKPFSIQELTQVLLESVEG